MENPFKGKSISIMGFSLGTIVASYTQRVLHQLIQKNEEEFYHCKHMIHDLYLLAGAHSFDLSSEEENEMAWAYYYQNVNGRFINCWSNRDGTLKYLFTSAVKNRKAIGTGNIIEWTSSNLETKKCENFDCSAEASGHLAYSYPVILNKIDAI